MLPKQAIDPYRFMTRDNGGFISTVGIKALQWAKGHKDQPQYYIRC